jgi:hypothetical protein
VGEASAYLPYTPKSIKATLKIAMSSVSISESFFVSAEVWKSTITVTDV